METVAPYENMDTNLVTDTLNKGDLFSWFSLATEWRRENCTWYWQSDTRKCGFKDVFQRRENRQQQKVQIKNGGRGKYCWKQRRYVSATCGQHNANVYLSIYLSGPPRFFRLFMSPLPKWPVQSLFRVGTGILAALVRSPVTNVARGTSTPPYRTAEEWSPAAGTQPNTQKQPLTRIQNGSVT